MKIGNPADKPAPAQANGHAAAAGETAKNHAAAVKPATPEASAKIELSSASSTLLESGTAEFDAEKVARISQAIDNGTFKINPEAIADKLIANATEVLSKTHR